MDPPGQAGPQTRAPSLTPQSRAVHGAKGHRRTSIRLSPDRASTTHGRRSPANRRRPANRQRISANCCWLSHREGTAAFKVIRRTQQQCPPGFPDYPPHSFICLLYEIFVHCAKVRQKCSQTPQPTQCNTMSSMERECSSLRFGGVVCHGEGGGGYSSEEVRLSNGGRQERQREREREREAREPTHMKRWKRQRDGR